MLIPLVPKCRAYLTIQSQDRRTLRDASSSVCVGSSGISIAAARWALDRVPRHRSPSPVEDAALYRHLEGAGAPEPRSNAGGAKARRPPSVRKIFGVYVVYVRHSPEPRRAGQGLRRVPDDG